MREFNIKYRAGTSPYWYSVAMYATDAGDAYIKFLACDRCPFNVREIKIQEI